MRVYVPTTLVDLAAAYSAGSLPPDPDVVVSEGDSEEDEYAALMTAADASADRLAGLPEGRRRRIVVVAEVGSVDAAVPFSDVVAVHADTADDADADDDLAWYATQELDDLLRVV
jgi:hypothetical protein